MKRTRRSIVRSVSALTVVSLATGAVSTSSSAQTAEPSIPDEEEWPESVSSVDLWAEEGDCEEIDEVDIGRWDVLVTIAGRISASTPCHAPTVESIEQDEGTLVVTLGTESIGLSCSTCAGYVEYSVSMELTDLDAVDDIDVVHDGVGEVGSESDGWFE